MELHKETLKVQKETVPFIMSSNTNNNFPH